MALAGAAAVVALGLAIGLPDAGAPAETSAFRRRTGTCGGAAGRRRRAVAAAPDAQPVAAKQEHGRAHGGYQPKQHKPKHHDAKHHGSKPHKPKHHGPKHHKPPKHHGPKHH